MALSMQQITAACTTYHTTQKYHLCNYLELVEQQPYRPWTIVKACHCYHGYAAMPRNKDARLKTYRSLTQRFSYFTATRNTK